MARTYETSERDARHILVLGHGKPLVLDSGVLLALGALEMKIPRSIVGYVIQNTNVSSDPDGNWSCPRGLLDLLLFTACLAFDRLVAHEFGKK